MQGAEHAKRHVQWRGESPPQTKHATGMVNFKRNEKRQACLSFERSADVCEANALRNSSHFGTIGYLGQQRV